jgi:hypothetical protein
LGGSKHGFSLDQGGGTVVVVGRDAKDFHRVFVIGGLLSALER